MDQETYNKQATDWRKLKAGDVVSTMSYCVAHADVVSYVTETMEDSDPWYLEDSPYGGPIVPPGYFYGEYIRLLAGANCPMGALNAKLVFRSRGPVLHGEQVTLKASIAKFYEKRGRPYMDVDVVVTNSRDVEVSRGIVTLLLDVN